MAGDRPDGSPGGQFKPLVWLAVALLTLGAGAILLLVVCRGGG